MAIIQISKIQQRSGNLVDLPQLDEAQFGWANDAKRLFIGATGNATTDVENVEVLTSYSTISFSQVEGSDGSNVNITNLLPGQVLGYDANTNSWVNTGGNTDVPNDPGAGIPIHLGTVSNVKIAGGATGYVLETDGAGNLSWTSKGTLYIHIANLARDTSNTYGILANAVIMTVANSTPYTNGTAVTISGVNGTSNSSINSHQFYIKLANDFPTSGKTILFNTSDLANANAFTLGSLTYTNAPNGVALTSLAGSSSSTPGGGNTQIQYNDSGILNGSANFVITGGNAVTLTGNFTASNVAGGNLVSANYITGTLTTAAQPNITSTGTLASLSVTANANIGNIGTAGLITATGNLNAGNIITAGIMSSTGNATHGNIITGGLITATGNLNAGNIITAGIMSSTGNATHGNLSVTGQVISSVATGTAPLVVTSTTTVANLSVATAGTVTTAAQPNITSTGTLASLSVTGNANIGNIGTVGLITATGNITGAYILGNGSSLSSITGANVTGAVTYATTANAVAAANVSGLGNVSLLNRDGNGSNVLYGNGVFATLPVGGYGNSNVAAFLSSYGSNTITTTGNISIGNIIGNGQALTGLPGANVTGQVGYAAVANSVAAANVSGLGNLALINKDGNASNILYGNGVFATASGAGGYGNSNVATFLGSYGSNTITTTGNISGGNVITSSGKYLINSVQTGISAAGSTQGTGTALANTINIVSTVSTGNGVVLPTAVAGMTIYITNTSATSLIVYPATGAAINELTANAGFTHPTKATLHYIAASSTQWYSVGATYA